MKITKFLLFVFLVQILFGKNILKETKLTNISLEKGDINIGDICLKINNNSKIIIIPSREIEKEKINIASEKNNIYDLLMRLINQKGYKIEEKKRYLYISKNNFTNDSKGRLIGNVYDQKYKTNIGDVKVKIVGSNYKEFFSDENGNFILEDIPFGNFFISLEKKGYEKEGELIRIDKKNNTVRIPMELKKIENNFLIEKEKQENFLIEKVKVNNLKEIEIEKLLQDKIKTVNIIKNMKQNILYLSGERESVAEVKKYLQNLDNNNKQVRITVKLIDITDNLFEKLGFSWIYDENLKKEKNQINFSILKNNGVTGIGESYSNFANILKTFKNDSDFLKFSLDLLETTQDLKITSVPSIVTVNGEEGEIKITEEKIVGQEKEEKDNNKVTYSPIFKEAGIILKVIPEILTNNFINLKIEVESSDFKSVFLNSNNFEEIKSKSGSGAKISRTLKTTLKIKEGDEVLIGGLKKEILKKEKSEVPILSSIPIFGKIFKYKTNKNEKVDLYIKLKVDVLKNNN